MAPRNAPTEERKERAPSSGSGAAGKLIALIAIILLAIFAVNAYTKRSVEKDQNELSQSTQQLQNKLSQLENDVTTLKQENQQQAEKLEKIPSYIYRVDEVGADARIVRTDIQAGKEDVVVASVKAAAGMTSKSDVARGFAVFPKEKVIIFRKLATGAGADEKTLQLDFWKYDIEKNTFEEVEALNAFDKQNLQIWSVPSPGKRFVAFVVADEKGENNGLSTKLYTYNLISGEVKTLLTLSDNQTFNARYGYPNTKVTLQWVDDGKLSVAIYDQSKGDSKKDTEKPLLQTQELKVE